jgi:hypothetical protein
MHHSESAPFQNHWYQLHRQVIQVLIRIVQATTAQHSLLGVMLSPILFYFSTIFLSWSLYHDLSVHVFFFPIWRYPFLITDITGSYSLLVICLVVYTKNTHRGGKIILIAKQAFGYLQNLFVTKKNKKHVRLKKQKRPAAYSVLVNNNREK